jgi:hypothetical protein
MLRVLEQLAPAQNSTSGAERHLRAATVADKERTL